MPNWRGLSSCSHPTLSTVRVHDTGSVRLFIVSVTGSRIFVPCRRLTHRIPVQPDYIMLWTTTHLRICPGRCRSGPWTDGWITQIQLVWFGSVVYSLRNTEGLGYSQPGCVSLVCFKTAHDYFTTVITYFHIIHHVLVTTHQPPHVQPS